jgi:hypothetical protein
MSLRTWAALGLTCVLAACGGGAASPVAPERPSLASQARGAAAASVAVHTTKIAKISRLVLGANMAFWFDITQQGVAPPFTTAGFTAVRWPGGSSSDEYHWQTHTLCNGGYADPHSTFDNFMSDVALPAHLDVAITLDYGSNAACNAGGDPAEAAAWVDYANNQQHYGVTYWTVGNENYGSWEYDLHAQPHDSATYAAAVAGGFYPAVKAKDPNAQVGVVVDPGWKPDWDTNVLNGATYDFVEYHYYAQSPGQESDAYLLDKAPAAFGTQLDALQAELTAAGHGATPIYVGELGSVYTNPGKQTTSITQALFAGMGLGEMLDRGIARGTWWLGYGGCSDPSSGGNFSTKLYGWQNFGGYMIFSDGLPESGCPHAPKIPLGTLLPTTRAYQLMALVARDGENELSRTLGGSASWLRAYAMTHGTGYAAVLFNLDKTSARPVSVSFDGLRSGRGYAVTTYGKAQYDQSKNNVWAGPVHASHGAWNGHVTLTLPAWSMNVLTASP